MRFGTWLSDRHYNCYSYYLETQEPKEDSHPCISATEQSGLYPVYCWDIPKLISFHWFSHVDSVPRGKWIGRELITSWLPQQSCFKRPLSKSKCVNCVCQGATGHLGRPMPCLLPACARPPTIRIHMQDHAAPALFLWLYPGSHGNLGFGSEPGDKWGGCLYHVPKWVLFHVQYFPCLLWRLSLRKQKHKKAKRRNGPTEREPRGGDYISQQPGCLQAVWLI